MRLAPYFLGVLASLACGCAARPSIALKRYQFTRPRMGVPFRVVFWADNDARAKVAAQAAFARIAELDRMLSDWNPDSELMRLCRTAGSGQAQTASPDLWFVLGQARAFWRRSGGAFDPTIGPLVRLWRKARKTKSLPTAAEVTAAQARTGCEHVVFQRHGVLLKRKGMLLDLGGIAKGYAADEALSTLRQHGITRALVDGSGDIAIGHPPPNADGWIVDSNGTSHSLCNVGIATSGDTYQFVEIGGVRYTHIVDPSTGLGLTTRRVVTVVAKDAMTADSLATALSVLDLSKGRLLIRATAGATASIKQDR